MKITKEDILKVASLARLSLTDDEISSLNMEGIIEFANKLNELETDDVNPTNHVLDVSNVFREDIVGESYDRDLMLSTAPSKARGCYQVPQVVGEASDDSASEE